MARRIVLHKILPAGSKRRKLAKYLLVKKKTTDTRYKSLSYEEWIKQCEPALFHESASKSRKATIRPLISIVVPFYNTPERYVDDLVHSLQTQVYENWQLCLADGSTDSSTSNYLKRLSKQDKRVTYLQVGKNLGIVGNTNAGLEMANGEFVAFMDHDDTLSPFALAEMVLSINEDSDVNLLYSDEDKLSDDGKQRLTPFFKPDWSPELLLGVNYITHFVVARKTIVDKIGGLREGFDGAQDYDFLLRFTEVTDKIRHIPKILYHWRLADGSTSKNVGEKDYADTAGRRALADAVKRRKIHAKVVEIPDQPTNYRLDYVLPGNQPKVSILIPFKDKPELLRQCVGSILTKTTYKNYELILLSNNSIEQETHNYLKTLSKEEKCRILYWDHPFNYSAINNYGSKHATGDYLVLLNNDTKVITKSWLEELIGVASQKDIGAVGPLLYYPNKTIQHAGVILGLGGMAGHVFRNHLPSDWTDFGMPAWPRNYLAVTAACLAVERKKYEEVGGLDEAFVMAGQDVAFGIQLTKAGYRSVYWPFAELIHYENVSVGSYSNAPQGDYDHSLTYYRPYLDWKDPYFNRNLDLMNEQVGLRSNYE